MTSTAPLPGPPLVEARPAGRGDVVSLRNVTKEFGDLTAVRGIDLDIGPGEVVAFLGPNGAGKTTTIDMVLGLSRPSSGDVRVLGMNPRDAIARGLVAAVMQTGGLLKDITVRETVAYTASLFADTRAVSEVLAEAGITHLADRLVGKCSGGEQQRLRFAMALLSDPALLLLDEPTTGMDVEGRRSFWSAIRRDSSSGRTVLFATHYLEEADQYADRIVLISNGRIVADGSGAEIRALATGRTLRATLPAESAAAVVRTLEAMPATDAVELRGDTVIVHARDSDTVARYLLERAGGRELEINAKGIEEAFLSLTGEHRGDGHQDLAQEEEQ